MVFTKKIFFLIYLIYAHGGIHMITQPLVPNPVYGS